MQVCVIGAGPAGLAALRHLASKPDIISPTAYEQSDGIGGTWLYTDKVGVGEDGSQHSSIYKNLV